jgi:hypothetical protein
MYGVVYIVHCLINFSFIGGPNKYNIIIYNNIGRPKSNFAKYLSSDKIYSIIQKGFECTCIARRSRRVILSAYA